MKHTGIWIFAKMWILSAVVLVWFGGYSYFVGNKINPETSFFDTMQLWMQNLDTSFETKKAAFDIQGTLEINRSDALIFSWSMDVKNINILSQNQALQQRISADEISIETNNSQQNIVWLDIISQNTKNYFYAKKLENIISQPFEKYKNILDSWKYIFVDNSKTIENTFENFDKNNIFIQMLIAWSTANPEKYMEINKFKSLFLQQLYRDDWIEYLFQKSENSQENLYKISQNICNDIEKISQNISENNFSVTKNQCENTINQLNFIVSSGLNISKKWDIAAGNYTFEISGDDILKIQAEYKKNILQDWSINYSQNDILVDIQGNKNKIISSNIDINIQKSPDDFITGNIVNGSGKITIKTNNNISKIQGEIIFENYTLFQYVFDGIKKSSRSEFVFSWKWNDHSGELFFEEKTAEKSLWEISLKYNRLNHNFSLSSENINISSVLKNRDFAVSFEEKNVSGEITSQAKIVHNNQVISGFIKHNNIDVTMEWTIQPWRIEILKIQWDVAWNDILYILETQDFSKDSAKIAAWATINDERFFDFILEKNTTKNTKNIKNSVITSQLDAPFLELQADLTVNISQKKPNILFEIPNNYEEIDWNISEMFVLPNIFEIWEKTYPFVAESIITSAGMFGSIWYIQDVENKKIQRNYVRQEYNQKLFWIIQWSILSGEIQIEDIIWEQKTDEKNQIRFAWTKIGYSQNYVEWNLSDKIIQLADFPQNFKPDEFRVAYVKNNYQTVLQLATFLEEKPGYKKIFINGNYSPRKIVRYNFSEYWEEDFSENQENKENKDEEYQKNIQNENTKSKISIVWFPHFAVWDMTNIWKVTQVNDDFIWIDSQIPNGATKIFLLWDDSLTLFHDEKNNVLENNEIFQVSQ